MSDGFGMLLRVVYNIIHKRDRGASSSDMSRTTVCVGAGGYINVRACVLIYKCACVKHILTDCSGRKTIHRH